MNDRYDRLDPQEEPLPPNPGEASSDQETLAIIEAAIASRHGTGTGVGASPNSYASASGGPGSLAAFSAHLAGTLPRMDESFHDDLLARLLQELSEPDLAAAQEPAQQAASKAEATLGQAGAKQSRPSHQPEPQLTTFRIPHSAFRIPRRGWLASSATALVGLAVLLLVVAGMLGIIRPRQDTNQSNKSHPDSLQLARSLQPLITLKSGPAAYIAWSPDGGRLATAEITNAEWPGGVIGNNWPTQTLSLKLWDVPSGSLLKEMTLQNIKSLAWSPDGSVLAVGLDRNTIKLLERDGRERFTLTTPFPDQMKPVNVGWGWLNEDAGRERLAWSPDSHILAATSGEPYTTDRPTREGMLRLWDPATGKLIRSIEVPDETTAVDRQNEGNIVVPADPYAIGWSPDGGTITANVGEALLLWKAATGELKQTIKVSKETDASQRFIGQFAWSPDGRTLAVSDGRYVELWNPTNGTYERSLPETLPPSPVPTGPAQTPLPEKSYLATFDAEQVSNEYSLVEYLAWSPDGSRIATYAGGALRLWDVSAGVRLQSIGTTAHTITWSPDSRLITSGDGDLSEIGKGEQGGTITFWDAASGAVVRTISDGQAYNFAWSPDGMTMAISTPDGVQLWGLGTPEPTQTSTKPGTPDKPTQHVPYAPSPVQSGIVPVNPNKSASPTPSPGWLTQTPISTTPPWITPSPPPTWATSTPVTTGACSGWSVGARAAGGYRELLAVSAASPSDVWAVGYFYPESVDNPHEEPLIMHWDGTAWTQVPSPNIANVDNRLTGVAAISKGDVWAVGYTVATGGLPAGVSSDALQTLTMHWDGRLWDLWPSPDVKDTNNRLYAIRAFTSNDIWAVGSYGVPDDESKSGTLVDVGTTGSLDHSEALIMHWDGTTWSIVDSPKLGNGPTALLAVDGATADDVWAVGYHRTGDAGSADTLILHWDGKQWSRVFSPNKGNSASYLAGVTAIDANNVLAVGRYYDQAPQDPPAIYHPLIVRWDGSSWSVVPSPGLDSPFNTLNGVAASSEVDRWAVGSSGREGMNPDVLIARSDGREWEESPVSAADPGGRLNAVTVLPTGEAWAVGATSLGEPDLSWVIMHYSPTACSPAQPAPSTAVATSSPTSTPLPSSPTLAATETHPAKAATAVPTTATGGIAGNTTLSAVSFIDANRGWLADAGIIYATIDGGQHWAKRHEAPGVVASLDFVSESQGWLTTAASVYGTQDGGMSWQHLFYLKNANLGQVDFTDASNGWLTFISDDANSTHGILHTSDGGRSWPAVTDPCGQLLPPGSFSFTGPGTGFMMCGGQPSAGDQAKQLLKTADAGHTWQLVTEAGFDGPQSPNGLATSGYLEDSFFLDDSHGWYSVNLRADGMLQTTTDGGKTWDYVHISDSPGIPYNMRFVTSDVGFTIYDSRGGVESAPSHLVLLGTHDGGASWKQLYPSVAPVGPVQYLDGRVGYGAATALDWGAILKTMDGGTSWTQVGVIPDLCGFGKLRGSQTDGGYQALISALDFSDPQHGFATAQCFAVTNPPDMRYDTTDGGATWRADPNK